MIDKQVLVMRGQVFGFEIHQARQTTTFGIVTVENARTGHLRGGDDQRIRFQSESLESLFGRQLSVFLPKFSRNGCTLKVEWWTDESATEFRDKVAMFLRVNMSKKLSNDDGAERRFRSCLLPVAGGVSWRAFASLLEQG